MKASFPINFWRAACEIFPSLRTAAIEETSLSLFDFERLEDGGFAGRAREVQNET